MKGKSFLKNLKFIKTPHIIYHATCKLKGSDEDEKDIK